MTNRTPEERARVLDEIIASLKPSSAIARLSDHQFTDPEPIKCPRCGAVDVDKYGVREGVQVVHLQQVRAQVRR